MEETGKTNGKKQKPEWDLQKYMVIALITFVTFCCCILFFFVLYRYHGFREGWQKLMKVLQPIIIGFIVAYLMNPVMVFLERNILAFLENRVKSRKKAKKNIPHSGYHRSYSFSPAYHIPSFEYDDSGISLKYPEYDGESAGRN